MRRSLSWRHTGCQCRAAQRGAWFPLLLGLLTLGGILVDRCTFRARAAACPLVHPSAGADCVLVTQGSPLYRRLGIALVHAATALLSLRRSSRRGVGTPVRPYVLTGIALVAGVAATAFWGTRHGTPPPGAPLDLWGLRLDPASGPARRVMTTEPDQHPVNGLDDVVRQRVRLGILTVAHQARRVEFGFLRTALGLTAGSLSRHLAVLEKAGLIHIEKGCEGGRPRTRLSPTPAGDRALREEAAQLKRLIHQIQHGGAPPRP